MLNKLKTIANITASIEKIRYNKKLYFAIQEHYTSMSCLYSTNPSFFKITFKRSRFLLLSILVSNYYISDMPLISDAIKKSISINELSLNSIYSFLEYLEVSKRIRVVKSSKDKRKNSYYLTSCCEKDVVTLMNSIIPSIKDLGFLSVKNNNELYYKTNFLEGYFSRYEMMIECGFAFFYNVENIEIFVGKDAGHMILLSFYINQENNIFTGSLSRISSVCNVSKTHLSRVIKESVENGLFIRDKQDSKIILTKKFNLMVEKYMATWFACIMYSIGVKTSE